MKSEWPESNKRKRKRNPSGHVAKKRSPTFAIADWNNVAHMEDHWYNYMPSLLTKSNTPDFAGSKPNPLHLIILLTIVDIQYCFFWDNCGYSVKIIASWPGKYEKV